MSQRQSSTSSLQIQKATFLPMLCSRPSIKSVTIPKSQDPSSLSLQDQDQDDPLSPKISCIGQVKRNNKITNLPTTINNKLHFTTPKHQHHHNHYFNLKRLFSAKSLTVSVSVSAAAVTVSTKSGNTITNTNSPRRGGGRRRREELVNIDGSKIEDDNINKKRVCGECGRYGSAIAGSEEEARRRRQGAGESLEEEIPWLGTHEFADSEEQDTSDEVNYHCLIVIFIMILVNVM